MLLRPGMRQHFSFAPLLIFRREYQGEVEERR